MIARIPFDLARFIARSYYPKGKAIPGERMAQNRSNQLLAYWEMPEATGAS
jgi:hypothetical protein